MVSLSRMVRKFFFLNKNIFDLTLFFFDPYSTQKSSFNSQNSYYHTDALSESIRVFVKAIEMA